MLTSSQRNQQQGHWQQLNQQYEQLTIEINTQLTLRGSFFIGLGLVSEKEQDTVLTKESIDSQRMLAHDKLSQMTEQQNTSSAEQQLVSGQLSTAKIQLNELNVRVSATEAKWLEQIKNSDFFDEQDFLSALLDLAQRQQLQQLFDDIGQCENQAKTLITQAQDRLVELDITKKSLELSGIEFLIHGQTELAPLDLAQADLIQIEKALESVSHQLKQQQLQIGQLTQQIKQDKNNKTMQQGLLMKISNTQNSLDDLSHLNALIGSADGAKFRRFAQG